MVPESGLRFPKIMLRRELVEIRNCTSFFSVTEFLENNSDFYLKKLEVSGSTLGMFSAPMIELVEV